MEYQFAPAGLDPAGAEKVGEALQQRLDSMIDLSLTLKHIQWNLVGPGFIAVHEQMDAQLVEVRAMVDEIAERIATLGGVPQGVPGGLVARRTWDDYRLGRATVDDHLTALDHVYDGIVADHRKAIDAVGPVDTMSEDLLIGQTRRIEQLQWLVRAHLENAAGSLDTSED
jgi:starvation-inducible DNA-binding protein